MAIQDDAKNFLLSALSRTGGDLPSLQIAWLATQGYTTGTIDDRWKAYLSANAYYLPEGLSRLLVGLNLAVGNNWLPNLLYQEGDILLWYDPSDLTTMFQDTAGTTQVSADGQSVALHLDKGQWGGKTLSQVLAAQPELLAAAAWSMSVGGGTATATNSPEGTLNLTGDGTNSAIGDQSFATVAGHRYKITCDVATNVVALYFGTTQGGTQLATTTFGAGSARTYTFVATGTLTWVRFFRTGAGTTSVSSISLKLVPGYHRTQATGPSMPKYKTDGTLHWLLYDGTDDSNQTSSITWGSDEVEACFGRTKSSDAAVNCLLEFSPTLSGNNGTFALFNDVLASQYSFGSKGTIATDTFSGAGFAAPSTNVLTCIGDISGDVNRMRIDGVQVAETLTDQGTGNYGNFVLNFGRRNNTSFPFNGREYQTVMRSRLLSAPERADLEAYVAAKTGVTL